jgi:cysteine desulfurase
MDPIYLDYNATTPIAPEVRAAMHPYLEQHFGNPSSGHVFGRAAQNGIVKARNQMALMLGARTDEIVFTSGGTEANNLAIVGAALARREHGRHLVTTAVEHPAVLEVVDFLKSLGWRVTIVAVDECGQVDPDAVDAAIEPDTVLVSVMHANNELGTILPVRAIADRARAKGVLVHCDAAQSVGKIRVRVADLGVDLLSIAGHKLYAPKGVGALYVKNGTPLTPVLRGAGQEAGRRPGTENTPYIVGLGEACRLVITELQELTPRYAQLRDRLEQALVAAFATEQVRVNGDLGARLPNTLNISFRGVEGDALLTAIPEIAASTGAACHADAVSISTVLRAIGLPLEWAKGTVRLTVGRGTTAEQIDQAAALIVAAVRERQR